MLKQVYDLQNKIFYPVETHIVVSGNILKHICSLENWPFYSGAAEKAFFRVQFQNG